jgi:hypothetical protein
MLYMKEMRAKVVAECTLKESAAINQILGRRVSPSPRSPFPSSVSLSLSLQKETIIQFSFFLSPRLIQHFAPFFVSQLWGMWALTLICPAASSTIKYIIS